MPALQLTSPGVQISETDLSQYAALNLGTNVFIPGFAAQGPTDEVIHVTTLNELQQIYGTPGTAAERYFYYSCAAVLNTNGNLYTTRLPYGLSGGYGFTNSKYGALFFPAASGSEGITFGEPKHISLTYADVENIKNNNFTWTPISNSTSPESIGWEPNITNAGLIIINESQTTVDEFGQGYYVTVTDNSNFGPNKDYTAVTSVETLTETDTFTPLSVTSLAFTLSASYNSVVTNSVSQLIENNIGYNVAGAEYQDCLFVNLWKLSQSVYNTSLLNATRVESYFGSLNPQRTKANSNGGSVQSFSLVNDINGNSNNMYITVHPDIASANNWTGSSSKYASVSANSMYAEGIYEPSFAVNTSKLIGNVYTKVQRALTLIDNPDYTTIDIIADAGLSTVFSNTSDNENIDNSTYYDDTVYMDTSDLSDPTSLANEGWVTMYTLFNEFCGQTRKDCVFIADPLRQIFVNGGNLKTLSVKTNNWTENIYNPLVASVGEVISGSLESSYAAIYANWVKVYDQFSNAYHWMPFSGIGAAVYANSDSLSYPWFAPAGLNRGVIQNVSGVVELAVNPNQKQRDDLYQTSINPVTFFPGQSFVVWGQKTAMSKPSAFDRVNVRRLFLYLERATKAAAKYFVFEPNTQLTRIRLTNTLKPIFDKVKTTQGVYDYLIICNDRNNTPDVIDRNELAVDIYIKPVKAAEYILVNFIATTTGANFQELAAEGAGF
jgi:hypothetical protein